MAISLVTGMHDFNNRYVFGMCMFLVMGMFLMMGCGREVFNLLSYMTPSILNTIKYEKAQYWIWADFRIFQVGKN